MSVYALSLFNIKSKEEYEVYAKEAENGLTKHGGRVVALGKLLSTPTGDIEPREVMMLVEWESMSSILNFLNDPQLAHIHPHRENGVDQFVWHLFEKFEALEPVLSKIL